MLKRRLVLIALVLTVSAWQLVATSLESVAQQPPDVAARLTSTALEQWATKRQCLYTSEGEKILKEAFAGVDPRKIQPALESYLDQAAWQSFGPSRVNCVIDAPVLQRVRFAQAAYASPETAYLTVSGTKRGAAIRIDKKLRGYIATTFAMSPGEYLVETMKCIFKVKLTADDRKEVRCRKA